MFSQGKFADYAAKKNLVLLEVDFPRMKKQSDKQKAANRKLAEQYGIEGFPTIVLLDPGGKTLGSSVTCRAGRRNLSLPWRSCM